MKRLIIKLTITLLVFALCFSTPLFVNTTYKPATTTFTDQTSDELIHLFQIDTYTAAEPFIQIEENQVTILFNTKQNKQLVYWIDGKYVFSSANENTHQITANLASGSHTINISLTNEGDQIEKFSYQVNIPESSQQKKMSQLYFTHLAAVREPKQMLI
ncbi:hypothetical protein [Listeria ilorinensis]|uniref:hypothetical protein n=1 Tax=Listeria ilorinensis TaxID=2867439 RepID=UPI001EF5AADE|nr:hypothetical protein [Listeria ilorinensis]